MEQQPVSRRAFGDHPFTVPVVALGCGPLGDERLDDRIAERLVRRALERGVDLFDTARSYGCSEERLGRFLADRPDALISTKVGYGIEGLADWTGACVAAGIERALRLLRRERIDLVHLHSCPREVLARDDVRRAVEDAVGAGKVRVAAYAGEEADLDAACDPAMPFRAVQLSVSIWDQRSLATRLAAIGERGFGVLAKRAIGNAPWRFADRPTAPDLAAYFDRHRALAIEPPLEWPELALRFTAFAPGVGAALVGTTSIEHLDRALDAVARGPLEPAVVAELRTRFDAVGAEWPGIV